MKRWIGWVGWVFLPVPLLYGDLIVVQKVEESGPGKQTSEITIKMKGTKIRADVSPDISIIMDAASGETTTINHTQKSCLCISPEAAAQLLKAMEHQRDRKRITESVEETPKIEPTGKKETITGQETKIFTGRAGEMKVTWWIAQKHPDAGKFMDMFALLQKTSMAKLAGGMAIPMDGSKLPGVPIKTEITMPDGRKISTTIVSIKEEALEDMDFTIPPGYHVLPKPKFGPIFSP